MGGFLILLGVRGWFSAFLALVSANTVFQEIAALLALGFGTLSFGLGIITTRLTEIRDILQGQTVATPAATPSVPLAEARAAAAVDQELYAPPADRFYVKDVDVEGIPGALFSDGSIDVVTADGTASYRGAAELKAAYGR